MEKLQEAAEENSKIDIEVKFQENRWVALSNEKVVITSTKCRACVVNVIKNLTANSQRYRHIIVYNEDGTRAYSMLTGANNGRTNQKDR